MRCMNICIVVGMACSWAHAQDCETVQSGMLESLSFMSEDHFGSSIATGNRVIVVGTPDDDEHGSSSGAAYIFEFILGTWVQTAKLESSDIQPGDLFGNTVSISGDILLIGAPGDDDHGSRSGSVYVFEFDGSGWKESAKLNASDAGSTDSFGSSLSVFASTAVIGSARNDENGTNSGAAYVFSYDGSQWSEEARLLASDGFEYDAFGTSVAVFNDVVLVGSPENDDHGNSSGSVYVYTNDGSGWNEDMKLTADDAAASDFFGISLALSSDTILVGSYWDDENGANSGSVYVYDFDGTDWAQQTKLIATDEGSPGQFGFSVALDGDIAIVGANKGNGIESESGSAYVYHFDGKQWDSGVKISASDGSSSDKFGGTVAIWRNVAVVGAAGHDGTFASEAGASYIFDLVCSCAADLTGDGVLNFFDVSAFLNAFANEDPAADFVPDGEFNFFDVGAFIGVFGEGCP